MGLQLCVLITDNVDSQCVDILLQEGFEVVFRPDMPRDEVIAELPSADALIVRSRTRVDAELLHAGKRLKIVGRAGAGVDNIDVETATRMGVIVMNTPGGNTVATAEHTMSMMLSLARNIPRAHQSVMSGHWERSKFVGIELRGKTVGILGFGKIGSEVARLCTNFGMTVLAYDPAQSEDFVSRRGARLMGFKELLRQSDFISIHVPLMEETKHLLSGDAIESCKRGVRIINCARGGIIDEDALLHAIEQGKVAGAALDVFEKEPPVDSRLVQHPHVIVTPHIGASTEEAQEKVAVQIAKQVAEGLKGNSLTGSINAEVIRIAMKEEVRPYLRLAESLGIFIAQFKEGPLKSICISQASAVPAELLPALAAACLRGLFERILSEPVNYLNAQSIAHERGVVVQMRHGVEEEESAHVIEAEYTTDSEHRVVAGKIFEGKDIRLSRIDEFHFEIRPEGYLLVYTNPDRPGMLAHVSKVLADGNINIAGLALGRFGKGTKALTIISLDEPVDSESKERIRLIDGIAELKVVNLSGR